MIETIENPVWKLYGEMMKYPGEGAGTKQFSECAETFFGQRGAQKTQDGNLLTA